MSDGEVSETTSVVSEGVRPLIQRAVAEYDALGLMSYHGQGELGWYADLKESDIHEIRALFGELAAMLVAVNAQVEAARGAQREVRGVLGECARVVVDTALNLRERRNLIGRITDAAVALDAFTGHGEAVASEVEISLDSKS